MIWSYKDFRKEIKAIYNGTMDKGYSTGWQNFDGMLNIKTGNLMVISGHSFRGKSFFLNNLLLNLTNQYGWKHLLFSFEVRVSKHFKEMAMMRTGKDFEENGYGRLSEKEIEEQSEFLSNHFLFPNTSKLWTVREIVEEIEAVKKEHDIKTVVIDPFNRIKKEHEIRETLFIEEMLGELSTLAKKLDILIVFIAHPTKPQHGFENTAPSLHNTAGSQAWYSICDYGLVVHRKKLDGGRFSKLTQIFVDKAKTEDLGQPCQLFLKWSKHKLIATTEEE